MQYNENKIKQKRQALVFIFQEVFHLCDSNISATMKVRQDGLSIAEQFLVDHWENQLAI